MKLNYTYIIVGVLVLIAVGVGIYLMRSKGGYFQASSSTPCSSFKVPSTCKSASAPNCKNSVTVKAQYDGNQGKPYTIYDCATPCKGDQTCQRCCAMSQLTSGNWGTYGEMVFEYVQGCLNKTHDWDSFKRCVSNGLKNNETCLTGAVCGGTSSSTLTDQLDCIGSQICKITGGSNCPSNPCL